MSTSAEDILEIFVEASRWGREHFETVKLRPCAEYFRVYRQANGTHINAQRRANRVKNLDQMRQVTRERMRAWRARKKAA